MLSVYEIAKDKLLLLRMNTILIFLEAVMLILGGRITSDVSEHLLWNWETIMIGVRSSSV